MQPFDEMGQGLPVRKRTRFTDKQRKLLYDIFTHGEESGKKGFPTASSLTAKKKFKTKGICDKPTNWITLYKMKPT